MCLQVRSLPLHPLLGFLHSLLCPHRSPSFLSTHVYPMFILSAHSPLQQSVLKAPKYSCWLPSPSHQGLRALHLQFETFFHSILANAQYTGTEALETGVVFEFPMELLEYCSGKSPSKLQVPDEIFQDGFLLVTCPGCPSWPLHLFLFRAVFGSAR